MVKIISDSTSDLSQDLLDRYNITLVPLIVRLGDQQYEDRVNITSEEIFRWSDSTKKAPTTACANVWTIQEVFQKYLETYDEIVAFSISGKMSATGANMVEAAAELGASDRIHVVDSQSLSTGIGLLVMEAAVMAQEGKSAKEIVAHVTSLIPLVRASFVVDTLTFLHRGGRCSGAAALMGSMLKLHPKIVVRDGQCWWTRSTAARSPAASLPTRTICTTICSARARSVFSSPIPAATRRSSSKSAPI